MMSVRKSKCIFILDFDISAGIAPYFVVLELSNYFLTHFFLVYFLKNKAIISLKVSFDIFDARIILETFKKVF